MGVGTTNERVDRATKLMGAILRVFVCDAALSCACNATSKVFFCDATLLRAIMVDSGGSCHEKADGRVFEGFITFLRYAFS